MKPYPVLTVASLLLSLAWLTGCVERRVVYVPTYQTAPVVAQTVAPTTSVVQANATPTVTAAPVVVYQTPPAAQVEVIPVSPGPDYVWVPGYWTWRGGWIWVRGAYAYRPGPHRVWMGGYWAPHGRGWVWHGGHWR